MNKTGIEYCDYTWNPFIGCNMYSSGCVNCYAYASLPRMVSAGIEGYTMDFDPYFFENRINEPRDVTQSSIIFCCSMGDFFFPEDDSWRDRVLEIMKLIDRHTFLILTKRSKEMVKYFKDRAVPKNVWVGVTVEASEYYSRVNDLLCVKTENRWISMEPLLGTWTAKQVERVVRTGIKWIVISGETGRAARPMDINTVSKVYNKCKESKISYFFKKYKGKDYTKIDTLRDGDFQIFRLRQFPDMLSDIIADRDVKNGKKEELKKITKPEQMGLF